MDHARSLKLLALSLALPACRDALQDYQDLRETCGLAPGEHRAMVSASDSPGVSADCALALGNHMHMQWHTLGELDEPLGFDYPTNAYQCMISAAYNLAAADLGSIRQQRERMGRSNRVAQALATIADEDGIDQGAPAGAMWLWVLNQRARFTRLDTSKGRLAAASHGSFAGIQFSYSYLEQSGAPAEVAAVTCLSTMVHELGHVVGVAHDAGSLNEYGVPRCDSNQDRVCYSQASAIGLMRDRGIWTASELSAFELERHNACIGILDRANAPECASVDGVYEMCL